MAELPTLTTEGAPPFSSDTDTHRSEHTGLVASLSRFSRGSRRNTETQKRTGLDLRLCSFPAGTAFWTDSSSQADEQTAEKDSSTGVYVVSHPTENSPPLSRSPRGYAITQIPGHRCDQLKINSWPGANQKGKQNTRPGGREGEEKTRE